MGNKTEAQTPLPKRSDWGAHRIRDTFIQIMNQTIHNLFYMSIILNLYYNIFFLGGMHLLHQNSVIAFGAVDAKIALTKADSQCRQQLVGHIANRRRQHAKGVV